MVGGVVRGPGRVEVQEGGQADLTGVTFEYYDGGPYRTGSPQALYQSGSSGVVDQAQGSWTLLFPRGVPGLLAPAFGVHPSTIWRNLQVLLYPPRGYELYANGQLLLTVYRECPGGRVVRLDDSEGRTIRGEARRRIIRALPRYQGRRRRRRVRSGRCPLRTTRRWPPVLLIRSAPALDAC